MQNWRDYVTDDVTLIFDLDSPCYMSASAYEKVELQIIHKESGRELFKEKNVEVQESVCVNPHTLEVDYMGDERPRYIRQGTGQFVNVRFKNRTEFWGRTKKVPSGWLGNLNNKREAEGKPQFSREDFEMTEIRTADDVSFAINSLKMKIQNIKDYLQIDRSIYLIGSGDSHRDVLELPANTDKDPICSKYKGDRVYTPRPILLKDVRQYAVNFLGAKDIKGVEADDVLNMYGFESHKHYKSTGKHKYILVTIDKDQRGFNCMLFNPFKTDDKEWKHPYPIIIDGFGKIDLVDGEVKGCGQLWLLTQMLIGDATDGYGPTRNMGISFGDVSAYKVLSGCKTIKEAVEAVAKQYLTWYPNGVQFKSWTGKDVNIPWWEWADTMWSCAYMLKNRDDKTSFTGVMKSLKMDYENMKLEESNG